MAQAHDVVSGTVEQRYKYQKKNYDRQVKAQTLVQGQPVWLREYPRVIGKSHSLMNNYSGPWVIQTKLSAVNFRIQRTRKGRAKVVHSDRLKPYHGPLTELWAREQCVGRTEQA